MDLPREKGLYEHFFPEVREFWTGEPTFAGGYGLARQDERDWFIHPVDPFKNKCALGKPGPGKTWGKLKDRDGERGISVRRRQLILRAVSGGGLGV
jgi:hypothetical protein